MISFHRAYHLSCVTYSLKKQGIKLCKMVNPKSKRQWYPTQSIGADTMPSLKSLTQQKHEPGKRGQRRTAMLNKMFMKQITDLMSTGTVAMDIVGRRIEISKYWNDYKSKLKKLAAATRASHHQTGGGPSQIKKMTDIEKKFLLILGDDFGTGLPGMRVEPFEQVSVTPDLHTVNVFWMCKGDASDNETEKVLSKAAGALRHELSTLRIMGEIPYIVFVKDKQEAHIIDLERRLAVADYGEDYSPTDIGHLLKSEFTLNTKLPPDVKAKIKKLEDEYAIHEEPLPEMTNNVFGLDHSKIMNRLLAARKKTRDAWSTLNTNSDVISYRVSLNTVPDNVTNQKKELADFLLKRQIMQKKLHKKMNDSRQDWLLADKVEGAEEVEEVEDDEEYEDDDEESLTYYSAHRELPNYDNDRQIKL